MRKSYKKFLSLFMAAAMTVSLGSGIGNVTQPKEAEAGTVYHAALGFCTSTTWLFRERLEGSANTDYTTKDASGKDIHPNEGGKGCSVYHLKDPAQTTQSGDNKVTEINYDYSKHLLKTGPTTVNDKAYLPGTYDVTITDTDLDYNNKSYSIKIEGLDKMNGEAYPLLQNDKADSGFTQLYISTDIPKSGEASASFSNIELYFDGQLVHKFAKAYPKSDNKDYWQLMLINQYGSKSNGDSPEKDGDKFSYTMPNSSMEIRFTVSGVGSMDSIDPTTGATTGALTSGPAASTTPTDGATNTNRSLAKGKTFTAGNFTYKVTKASKKSGSATVAVSGVKKSAQKKASLSVPKTVSKKKFKYKVTAVNGNAFAKCKKLKSVTLGANVKTLNKNAFAKCSKLSKLKLNAKLTKVAKGAFKGCKKKIVVSGKGKAANVKKIKKSGYKKVK